MNPPITDMLLDRFADGELSPAEEQQLLASLDGSPDGWRRCALAMVEARVLGRQMKGLVAPEQPTVAVAIKSPRGVAGPAWLALAAGLLLGVGMTALVSSRAGDIEETSDPTSAPIAADLPSARPTEDAANVEPLDPGEAITLFVHDAQGQRRSLRVPLVDAAELNDRYGMEFQSAVSDDMRRDLEQNGYRLTTRQRYAPLYLEGGRPFVVPVEDTQITAVAHEVL